MFINLKFNSWNDYFQNIDKPTENNIYSGLTFDSEKETLNITSKGNAYVYNCYFNDLTAYDGAAILFSQSNSYLLVEKCSIYKKPPA